MYILTSSKVESNYKSLFHEKLIINLQIGGSFHSFSKRSPVVLNSNYTFSKERRLSLYTNFRLSLYGVFHVIWKNISFCWSRYRTCHIYFSFTFFQNSLRLLVNKINKNFSETWWSHPFEFSIESISSDFFFWNWSAINTQILNCDSAFEQQVKLKYNE